MNPWSAIIDSMAQLIVRNLDDEIVTRLRRRAAHNGRSAEEEHRAILRGVLMPEQQRPSFKDYLLSMPDAGADRDFRRIGGRGRRVVKL